MMALTNLGVGSGVYLIYDAFIGKFILINFINISYANQIESVMS